MKKNTILLLAILAAILVFFSTVSSFTCCNKTIPKQLDIYVWEGYVPEEVAALFEEETGIKLNITFITDSEKMLTLIKGGGKADVIMPTDPKIISFYENDLVQPLDLEKIPNHEKVFNSIKDQSWAKWDGSQIGSGEIYAIPYIFGTTGLVINTSKYLKSLDNIGWEVLLDTDLKKRVSARNGIFTVLMILDMVAIPRENLLKDTEGTLEQIRGTVIELKNNALKFYDTYAEIFDLVKNEEVWVSYIPDGQGRKLSQLDPKFKYILPKTGGLGWTDTFMIPKSAANPAGVHLFIDFMLRPEIAAILTEKSGYTTTVEGALDMTKDIDKDLFRYTDKEITNLKWSPSLSEDLMSTYYTFWEEIAAIQ